MADAHYWIDKLNLQPHPEGGYYRVTYAAAMQIAQAALPENFTGARAVSTAIYFLLSDSDAEATSGGFSAFHRLQSDEMWHFYAGSPLAVHQIDSRGVYSKILLGPHPEQGEQFQAVVEAGCWFASAPLLPDTFALVGCTVAPGFDFADFELARRAELVAAYPEHAEVIEKFTRQ